MYLIIYGEPRTKKNNPRICTNKATGRPFIMPSKEYVDYEKDCLVQIRREYKAEIDYPVNVKYRFYRSSRRPVDLTNLEEAMDDILVKAKVLKDDNRNIVASHDESLALYDKNNPRVEIWIDDIKDWYIGYESWSSKKKEGKKKK